MLRDLRAPGSLAANVTVPAVPATLAVRFRRLPSARSSVYSGLIRRPRGVSTYTSAQADPRLLGRDPP